MTDVHILIHRMLEQAKALDGEPPYSQLVIPFDIGEISLIAKGLELLAAVRAAQER